MTFAEVYWVLISFYKFDKNKILPLLDSFIGSEAIDCSSEILHRTLTYLRGTNLSFIDGYTAAYSVLNSDSKILSFDKGFDKLKELVRIEP